MFCFISLLQLSVKEELKMSEALDHGKKDKKVKDLSMSPKKKKRKQRSPAKVRQFYHCCILWRVAQLQACEIFTQ